MDKEINFQEIEKKWQDRWEKDKIFEVKENSKKPKYYILEMFPYPSGTGLHMGHALNYSISDIYARFKRMSGFNVLYPAGYDSLGLPAENAAIKANTNPDEYTKKSIAYFSKQQKTLGLSYDWSRMLITSTPEYYKWDQWIFLKMFEKGLVYQKKSAVNWCEKCNTVLANEQVHNGKCWIHTNQNVSIKHLTQWYLKITDYAEQLNNFDQLKDWPELIKKLQKNWIGKSHGTQIDFKINNKIWPVFTTRPDTIYGVTFLVISAQHSNLLDIVTKEQKPKVEEFLKKLNSVSEENIDQLEKEGVFTGSYAINPINNEKIPVYAGNFVLADYGSGIVMAVPAHDQRDFEFAKKYNIPIKVVIKPDTFDLSPEKMSRAYCEDGTLINSDKFNFSNNRESIDEITSFLEKQNLGKKVINYKLRDWLISRQRYWGTPIPIIHCEKCGAVPVPEKDLPIKLPKEVKFGKGNPLETNQEFLNTTCPKCNGKAKRETDTMDTFVNSSWYYLRYCDSKNNEKIFDKEKVKHWCPVDFYIGGKEHACMHLIYIRFYTKFLRDLGWINFDEPAKKLFNQGYLYGTDGKKMSKSLGNVKDPMEIISKYSADSIRSYLVSVSSPESDFNWSEGEMQSIHKFIKKITEGLSNLKLNRSSLKIQHKINKTIKNIQEYIKNLKYNLAIIDLRNLFDSIIEEKEIAKKDFEKSLKLLSPFCPHISEELWENIGNKSYISLEKWPEIDESKINEKFDQSEKALEKTVSDIMNILKIMKEKSPEKEISKIYVYVTPNEIENYNQEQISKRTNQKIQIFASNDPNKHDPENKAKKAKPGKPGIYIE